MKVTLTPEEEACLKKSIDQSLDGVVPLLPGSICETSAKALLCCGYDFFLLCLTLIGTLEHWFVFFFFKSETKMLYF